jgi:hypothetical protein
MGGRDFLHGGLVSERRVHPRLKGPFEGSWGGSGRVDRIIDVSVGGCFVESVTTPPAAQQIRLSITFQGRPFTVRGVVLYSEQNYGFAVRFEDPPPEMLDLIERAVSSEPPR